MVCGHLLARRGGAVGRGPKPGAPVHRLAPSPAERERGVRSVHGMTVGSVVCANLTHDIALAVLWGYDCHVGAIMALPVRVPCRFDKELPMFGKWFKSTGSSGDSTIRDRSGRIAAARVFEGRAPATASSGAEATAALDAAMGKALRDLVGWTARGWR